MKFCTTFLLLLALTQSKKLHKKMRNDDDDPTYDESAMPSDRTGTYSPKENMWTGFEGKGTGNILSWIDSTLGNFNNLGNKGVSM